MPKNITLRNTPHLFIWISDSQRKNKSGELSLKEDELPMPHGQKLNYLSTLQQECAKLKKTQNFCYLIYSSRLLNPVQRSKMEELANQEGFENLIVIDYGEFEQKLTQKDFLDLTFDLEEFKTKTDILFSNLRKSTPYSTTEMILLVDSLRLALIYNCDILKKIASLKYQNEHKKSFVEKSSSGILYRDFDVVLKETSQPETLEESHICSTDHLEQIEEFLKQCKENPNYNEQEMQDFLQKNIFNIANYQENIKLFAKYTFNKAPISKEEMLKIKEIEDFLAKFFKIDEFHHGKEIQNPNLFFQLFIKVINLENSLLATNNSKSEILKKCLDEVFKENQAPYGAVLNHFRISKNSAPSSKESYDHCLNLIHCLEIEKYFRVDSDKSWQFSKFETAKPKPLKVSRPKVIQVMPKTKNLTTTEV